MPSDRRRPHVGMALYGDLTFDSRVRREASALAEAGYDVSIACLAGSASSTDLPAGIRVVECRPPGSVVPGTPSPFTQVGLGRRSVIANKVGWLRGYVGNVRAWGRQAVEACGPVDIWHAHDLTGLAAVGRFVPPDTPLVYDAHELFLETGSARRLPGPLRILLRAYERRLVARCVAVVTVNGALGDVLRHRYHPRRIEAIHNCPDSWSPPSPRPRLIRDAAGVPDGSPVLLYHGALSPNRGIEQLMEALLKPGLELAHLAVLGYGEKRADYVKLASEGGWAGRVHVLDPVPPAELLPWVASADLGAMPIQASTLNHFLSTPNKLFECLAAGTPVVTSNFPAMAAIVANEPAGALGETCDPADIGAIAQAVRVILELDDPARRALVERCLLAARSRWNWQREAARLVSLYADVCPVQAHSQRS
jgi:glycosyltransferase involved in cell wall biosynthesis